MLEAHSPLGAEALFQCDGVLLSEAAGFVLTQVAGDEKALQKALGKLPARVGEDMQNGSRRLMRVGPKQIWVLGAEISAEKGIVVTPLSSGRTRLLLEGAKARDLLASCVALDFSTAHFKPGQFVLTGIHHTPVTIHCIGENAFHIYTLRTFARDVWEWLCDVALGLER